MQAVSDEQLIEWVARGDASCLGTLFERHHRALYQYCLQLTRHRATSEDLVQDTFMKILKKAGSFRGDGSFKAWLFHIARNEAFNHLRKAKRRKTSTATEDDMRDQLIDSRSAEQAAAGHQDMDIVRRALDSLPEAAREVIWLGRFEFDGYEDLGAALGCTAATARVRMHRAMKQLDKILIGISGDIRHA
ncbi:MAG: sigma-70 family RNA polymerase sigma factor [Woeseiaceae bacterium]|nr:sigma-70 family RNA polymerase sigma factor [Woeseiaceae bacterium]